ncbi:MAG TPA: hypothetical protein VHZ56_04975 [Devosia sp.]|nr:hypothetical protein [Devosia sp.]
MTRLASLALAVVFASALIAPVATVTAASAATCGGNCQKPPPPPPPGNTNPPPPGDPGNPFVPPGSSGGPETHDPSLLISCEIKAGSLDLVFRNSGKKTISAGTPIHWKVAETGELGAVSLSKDLPPGGKIDAASLLKAAGLPADHCTSKLL